MENLYKELEANKNGDLQPVTEEKVRVGSEILRNYRLTFNNLKISGGIAYNETVNHLIECRQIYENITYQTTERIREEASNCVNSLVHI